MTTVPLRHVAEVWTSSVDKHSREGELPVQLCNYVDAYRNDTVEPGPEKMRATATPEEVSRNHLEVGDSVFTKDSEDYRDIGISAFVTATADDFVCGYHLAIARPNSLVYPRYLNWSLRGQRVLDHFGNHASGISRYGISLAGLRSAPIALPDLAEQRRIADFLDDRVARIDQILAARHQQIALVESEVITRSFDMIRGATVADRRASCLTWLADLPADWPELTVGSEFHVDLGKMLDEKRQTGEHAIPYLRNTNVQWDRVDVDDLNSMDIAPAERARYTVAPGDLMICEGGQPGRAAIWDGDLAPLGYQKALHRARSRGRSTAAWLLECLRVAVHMNVFAVDNQQTTIAHLTNEQLRALRFPFPDRATQERLTADLATQHHELRSAAAALSRSIDLLTEYKQSLITAAVTGELDVTTACGSIPADTITTC